MSKLMNVSVYPKPISDLLKGIFAKKLTLLSLIIRVNETLMGVNIRLHLLKL